MLSTSFTMAVINKGGGLTHSKPFTDKVYEGQSDHQSLSKRSGIPVRKNNNIPSHINEILSQEAMDTPLPSHHVTPDHVQKSIQAKRTSRASDIYLSSNIINERHSNPSPKELTSSNIKSECENLIQEINQMTSELSAKGRTYENINKTMETLALDESGQSFTESESHCELVYSSQGHQAFQYTSTREPLYSNLTIANAMGYSSYR